MAGDEAALAAAFPALCALQPVAWAAGGLVCAPRAAPELAGPALAACPLPHRPLARVPGWPDPPARWLAGWYLRSPAHAPAPAGLRELVQAPGEGFGPAAHATTAMCLEALEALAPGPALDAGCGSGLLAQAWARWGAARCWPATSTRAPSTRPRAAWRPPAWRGRVTLRRAALGALAPEAIAGRVLLANVPAAAHRELLGRVGAPRRGGAAVGPAARRRPRRSRPPTGRSAWRPAGRAERGGFVCAVMAGPVSRVWRTWAVLVLFALGTSLITPLIPLYQDELGFGDTVVTLFLGCYVMTLVPSMLSLGQLSDRVGRKRVLLIGDRDAGGGPGHPDRRAAAAGAAGGARDPGPCHRRLLRHLHRLPGQRRTRSAGAASCRCWARSRSASGSGPDPGSAG